MLGEGARKHFEEKHAEPRPISTFKSIAKKESTFFHELKPQGKRMIITSISNPVTDPSHHHIPEKRHHVEAISRRSEESPKLTVDWASRNIPVMENGIARNQRRSEEFLLADTMTRKKPVVGALSIRNDIPIAVLGDKPYKVPEHSVGFYKKPGAKTIGKVREEDVIKINTKGL